jgi:hypothetical protein
MDFLGELWLFMRVRKKFWLMPIFFLVVTVGGTYGAAGQGFRENQGMEFTEKGI